MVRGNWSVGHGTVIFVTLIAQASRGTPSKERESREPQKKHDFYIIFITTIMFGIVVQFDVAAILCARVAGSLALSLSTRF